MGDMIIGIAKITKKSFLITDFWIADMNKRTLVRIGFPVFQGEDNDRDIEAERNGIGDDNDQVVLENAIPDPEG